MGGTRKDPGGAIDRAAILLQHDQRDLSGGNASFHGDRAADELGMVL